jgi:hypothetical protein
MVNNSTRFGGNGFHDLLEHYALEERVEATYISLRVMFGT